MLLGQLHIRSYLPYLHWLSQSILWNQQLLDLLCQVRQILSLYLIWNNFNKFNQIFNWIWISFRLFYFIFFVLFCYFQEFFILFHFMLIYFNLIYFISCFRSSSWLLASFFLFYFLSFPLLFISFLATLFFQSQFPSCLFLLSYLSISHFLPCPTVPSSIIFSSPYFYDILFLSYILSSFSFLFYLIIFFVFIIFYLITFSYFICDFFKGLLQEYRLTKTQGAILPTIAISATVIGSVVWGVLADRVGRRYSILLSTILFIATSICGAMPSFATNVFMCWLMGVSVGEI